MTHFWFRYKRVGYMRWRCQAASRRTTLLLPFTVAAGQLPNCAAWRRTIPFQVPLPTQPAVLHVGAFVVSQQGDPQLSGHPDIRY